MVFQRLKGGRKRITLRNVIVHMQSMGQRLSGEIRLLSTKIDNVEQRLSTKIDKNTEAIAFLTRRVDALDEDLTATIKDTLRIRAHVGMPLPDQE